MIIKTSPHAVGFKCIATIDRSGLPVVTYGKTRKDAKAKALSGWLKCTPIIDIVGV